MSGQSWSDLEEASARKRHRRTNERKKSIIFRLDKILFLLYEGSKDLKWSLIPGSNPEGRKPSFSRGFKMQCCSGFKPSVNEDPNMVTKCLGSKHNQTVFSKLLSHSSSKLSNTKFHRLYDIISSSFLDVKIVCFLSSRQVDNRLLSLPLIKI